jgi:hypothetical protein
VSWFLIEDALTSGPKSIGFPDTAPCDGSLSFPDLGEAPYNGSTPVIVYDAACGVPLTPPPPSVSIGGLSAREGDDVDRLEVARPSDPSDPCLLRKRIYYAFGDDLSKYLHNQGKFCSNIS